MYTFIHIYIYIIYIYYIYIYYIYIYMTYICRLDHCLILPLHAPTIICRAFRRRIPVSAGGNWGHPPTSHNKDGDVW